MRFQINFLISNRLSRKREREKERKIERRRKSKTFESRGNHPLNLFRKGGFGIDEPRLMVYPLILLGGRSRPQLASQLPSFTSILSSYLLSCPLQRSRRRSVALAATMSSIRHIEQDGTPSLHPPSARASRRSTPLPDLLLRPFYPYLNLTS